VGGGLRCRGVVMSRSLGLVSRRCARSHAADGGEALDVVHDEQAAPAVSVLWRLLATSSAVGVDVAVVRRRRRAALRLAVR